jgi:hypothetical protein
MASQFKLYRLSLPVELQNAEKLWLTENPHAGPVIDQVQVAPTLITTSESSETPFGQPLIGSSSDDAESDGDENEETLPGGEPQTEPGGADEAPTTGDDSFDGRLSSIFIVPSPPPRG